MPTLWASVWVPLQEDTLYMRQMQGELVMDILAFSIGLALAFAVFMALHYFFFK